MPETGINSIKIKTINSLGKLLDELYLLEKTLPCSKLNKLVTFSGAYIVVTSAIEKTCREGGFNNPIFIERFTLSFASYYFQIINDALEGGNNMPAAWANLLNSKERRQSPNFIYLLMGANAHINHDLSFVMLKMLNKNDTQNLVIDIIKVDRLLVGCGDNILHSFRENKKLPGFIKDRTNYLYLPIIMHIVLYW